MIAQRKFDRLEDVVRYVVYGVDMNSCSFKWVKNTQKKNRKNDKSTVQSNLQFLQIHELFLWRH